METNRVRRAGISADSDSSSSSSPERVQWSTSRSPDGTKARGATLTNPRAVIELGPAKPGAVVPDVTPNFANIGGSASVLYADEMARYERGRSQAYFSSDEWLAWAAANGGEADARQEQTLMLYRDHSIIEAVAAGIRLVVLADDKAMDQPEQKRFRRMTKSH